MIRIQNRCVWVFSNIFMLCIMPLAQAAVEPNKHSDKEHIPHWSYDGASSPDKWGDISKEYALCGSGKRQSPVNIWSDNSAPLYSLRTEYQTIPMLLVNNGHTLQVNYNSSSKNQTVDIGGKNYPVKIKPEYNSTLMFGDDPYQLLQLHFHTPSEHATRGERYAMEVHLVHKNAGGNLAVIGVLLKRGNENPTLQKILDNAPHSVNEITAIANININAADFLPSDKQYDYYSGSLTTPPCSENVNWIVMNTSLEVSDAQVKRFSQLVGQNARPLQNINWRSVLTSQ